MRLTRVRASGWVASMRFELVLALLKIGFFDAVDVGEVA